MKVVTCAAPQIDKNKGDGSTGDSLVHSERSGSPRAAETRSIGVNTEAVPLDARQTEQAQQGGFPLDPRYFTLMMLFLAILSITSSLRGQSVVYVPQCAGTPASQACLNCVVQMIARLFQ